jgi:hypothetical protein
MLLFSTAFGAKTLFPSFFKVSRKIPGKGLSVFSVDDQYFSRKKSYVIQISTNYFHLDAVVDAKP